MKTQRVAGGMGWGLGVGENRNVFLSHSWTIMDLLFDLNERLGISALIFTQIHMGGVAATDARILLMVMAFLQAIATQSRRR